MKHLLYGFKTSPYNCISHFDKYLSYKRIVKFLSDSQEIFNEKTIMDSGDFKELMENKLDKLSALKEHIT